MPKKCPCFIEKTALNSAAVPSLEARELLQVVLPVLLELVLEVVLELLELLVLVELDSVDVGVELVEVIEVWPQHLTGLELLQCRVLMYQPSPLELKGQGSEWGGDSGHGPSLNPWKPVYCG